MKKYDGEKYDKEVMDSCKEVSKIVLQHIIENFDLFNRVYDKKERKEELEFKQDLIDYTGKIFSKIAETKLPVDYIEYCVGKIIDALTIVNTTIGDLIKEYKEEILTRKIGVVSPLDNSWNYEFATFKDLVECVAKSREETKERIYKTGIQRLVAKQNEK